MAFRCPLRNEWDGVKHAFHTSAKKPGREGAIARLMLDFMPVMCTAVERERDKETPPHEFFDAVAAVAGALIEEAIEQKTVMQVYGREQHLDRMLQLINRVVRPRMAAAKQSRLIVPEY
ncbi:hypothetical protein AC629_42280 [Bradyrhizobium sp. NAS80.1]|uniref:hypothetical protein n=1 Tax=Bradyrhizobium sp. NAS80.1 TaxID=1680159 RepID=UPI00095E8D93|nr:hypothetical protein [Bradyrhizobium sp. NAS80.1]OKO68201.1 hypothetical protein AC629_42280 [Bradyrhizobium sp. NAS80.1]